MKGKRMTPRQYLADLAAPEFIVRLMVACNVVLFLCLQATHFHLDPVWLVGVAAVALCIMQGATVWVLMEWGVRWVERTQRNPSVA